MPRISLIGADGLSAEQRVVYDAVVSGPRGAVVGPLRAALHSPELADRWQKLGEQLRFRTSLPARLSELAIITVARFWNSNTEWSIHAEIARKAGLPAAVIEAIRLLRPPVFDDPQEAAIYDYVGELMAHGHVSDETYGRLHGQFDDLWMVELTALVGYYSMVALTLNAHEIPAPASAGPDLPPPAPGAQGRVSFLPPSIQPATQALG